MWRCAGLVEHIDMFGIEALMTCFVGEPVRCYFCGDCTSHIYHHQAAMPDKIVVRTLLLNGGDQMPATAEIFPEGRLGWVRELQEILTNGDK